MLEFPPKDVLLVCVPGKHVGPTVSFLDAMNDVLPVGWRIIPVKVDPRSDEWIYSPASGSKVMCCGNCSHRVRGLPDMN